MLPLPWRSGKDLWVQIMQMTLGNLRQKEVSGASIELKELQNLWTSVALETSEEGVGGTSL